MTCSKIDEGLAIIRTIADKLNKLGGDEVTDNTARQLFEKNGLIWVSNCSDEEIRELICRGRDPVEYLTSCPYEVLIKAWNAVKENYFAEKREEVAVIDIILNNRADSDTDMDEIVSLMSYVREAPDVIIPGLASMHSNSDLFSWNNEMKEEEMTAVRDLLKYYRQKYHKKIMSYRELFREMGTLTMWEYMKDSYDYDPETTIYLWYKEHDPKILVQKYYEEGIPGRGTYLKEFLKSQQDLDQYWSIIDSAMEKFKEEMGLNKPEEDYDPDDVETLGNAEEHLNMITYYYPMHVKEMLKQEDGLVSYLMNEGDWLSDNITTDGDDYTWNGDCYDEGLADYFRCMGETNVWSIHEC